MQIIAFSGVQGAGKTSAAQYVQRNYNKQVAQKKGSRSCKIVSFATPLKEMASRITGIYLEDFTDPNRKDRSLELLHRTPRQILLQLAIELKQVDPNYVLKSFENTLDQLAKDLTITCILIDDLRTNDELSFLKSLEHSGKCSSLLTVNIVRSGYSIDAILNITSGATDLVIYNNKDIRHFYAQLDEQGVTI